MHGDRRQQPQPCAPTAARTAAAADLEGIAAANRGKISERLILSRISNCRKVTEGLGLPEPAL
jgi:hypothetical protein